MSARADYPRQSVGSRAAHVQREEMLDELDRLRRWKAEATAVITEWEAVWEAAGRPGRLGESKARATRDEINRRLNGSIA
jgi:hypothetical protein